MSEKRSTEEAIKTLRSFIVERCDPKHPTTRVIADCIDILTDRVIHPEAENEKLEKEVSLINFLRSVICSIWYDEAFKFLDETTKATIRLICENRRMECGDEIIKEDEACDLK